MRGAPPVLAYHKVGTAELGGTWCTRAQFGRHLEALARRGFRGIDLCTFEARLATPPGPALEREFLVSFDDAFESFAVHAWPELRRRGVPVALFVVTDFVGRRASWDLALPGRRVAHLDWTALGDLQRAGVAIGSHAASHRDLRRLDDTTLERELAGSRATLEDALGIEVRGIAYPFGRSDARVHAAVERAGYRFGLAMSRPPGALDRWAIGRHGVYRTDGTAAVIAKVDPQHAMHAAVQVAERAISACAAIVARRSRAAPSHESGSPTPIWRKST